MEDFVPDEQENRTRSGKGSTKSVKAKKDPNAPKKRKSIVCSLIIKQNFSN